MTIQQFNAATYYVKRTMINFHGVLLMKTESNVWLYEVDGFYVEVCYSSHADNHPAIRSCPVDALDKYLPQIDISTILLLL